MEVQNKIQAILLCEHRPLRPGEQPKRKGQDTVYEATGKMNPDFVLLWGDKTIFRTVTVKHDGMCSNIVRSGDQTNVFRRYDLRKGNTPPPGSVPAGKNSEGDIEFCWIDVTNSTDYADFYYLSAFQKNQEKIETINLVVIQDSKVVFRKAPIDEISTGTYELIGPKVQSNRYGITEENVEIRAIKKGKLATISVPKHYFVKHGASQISEEIISTALCHPSPVQLFSDFIMSNSLEGLVVHFWNGTMFKVNRGHIDKELKQSEGLSFLINQDVQSNTGQL